MTDSTKGIKDSLFTRLSLYRGIYSRVARQLGIDPSYVSRVARGERTSPAVSEALRAEIQLAFAKASAFASAPKSDRGNGANGSAGNGHAPKVAKRKTKTASA